MPAGLVGHLGFSPLVLGACVPVINEENFGSGHGLVWFWLVFRVLPANKRKLVCFPGYHKEKQTSFSLFSAGLNNPYFYRV